MKKLIAFLIILILGCLLSTAILFRGSSGDVSNVEIQIGESEIYTEAEIRQAMDVVLESFSEFSGCEMTRLWYDEERSLKEADDWAKQYNAKQAIVLFSDFNVDENGADKGLNPNDTYRNFNWILVRDTGKWKLKTWGY